MSSRTRVLRSQCFAGWRRPVRGLALAVSPLFRARDLRRTKKRWGRSTADAGPSWPDPRRSKRNQPTKSHYWGKVRAPARPRACLRDRARSRILFRRLVHLVHRAVARLRGDRGADASGGKSFSSSAAAASPRRSPSVAAAREPRRPPSLLLSRLLLPALSPRQRRSGTRARTPRSSASLWMRLSTTCARPERAALLRDAGTCTPRGGDEAARARRRAIERRRCVARGRR